MIDLLTLGRLSVALNGEQHDRLASHKQKMGLLVYLAVEAPVMRDRLLGTFWAERDEEKARHSLSQAIYALKRQLETDCLKVNADRIEIAPGQLSLDVNDLEDAAEAGRWETVVDLYQGRFLDGFYLPEAPAFDQWLTNTRAWVERLARRGFAEVIRARSAGGDVAGALAVASRWVALEPQEDEAQHALIALLARSGDRGAALTQYEIFSEQLSREQLEPLDVTRELVRRIREGELPQTVLIGDVEPGAVAAMEKAGPLGGPIHGQVARLDAGKMDDIEALLHEELGPHFEIEDRLGESTTSRVYRVRQPGLRRWLAVKVFSPALAENSRARMRFGREVQAVGSLSHPNIVSLHWAGMLSNGLPYFSMEYVAGRTLAERLRAEESLSVDETRRVMREMASALTLAHRRGVVHRDLQPNNVLLDEDTERSLLSDFGIARILATAETQPPQITESGELVGNPTYMSPEQLMGERITDRCDVYGLGLLAFEMLTGRGPYDADSRQEKLAAHIKGTPRPISDFREDVDEELQKLIAHCLVKQPEHRPSAADVLRHLESPEPFPALRSPDDGHKSFFTELVGRRVPHVLAVFAPAGFLVVELVGQLEAINFLPAPAHQLTIITYLVGLPGATIGAWFHGEEGRQQRRRAELCWYGILAAVWLAACGMVLFG
jgi:DNA-binding SARP family transcriptional activator